MAQGGLTARILLVDSDGNEVGVENFPIEVGSAELLEAITSLTEEVRLMRELLHEIVTQ